MDFQVCIYNGDCPYQKVKVSRVNHTICVLCRQPKNETCNQKRVVNHKQLRQVNFTNSLIEEVLRGYIRKK